MVLIMLCQRPLVLSTEIFCELIQFKLFGLRPAHTSFYDVGTKPLLLGIGLLSYVSFVVYKQLSYWNASQTSKLECQAKYMFHATI